MSGFFLGEEWRMSIAHIKAVMENPHFTSSENALLFCLAYHVNGTNGIYRKLSTLQAETGLSRNTIKRTLRSLEKCGCVVTKQRPPKTSLYTLQQTKIDTHQQQTKTAPLTVPNRPVEQCQMAPIIEGNVTLNVERTSLKPSPKESVPEWITILSQDKRWKPAAKDYIAKVEARFGKAGIDLAFQADKMYEWLQVHSKGQRAKGLSATWLNWLQREASSVGVTSQNGQRPRQSLDGPDRLEVMKKARREAMQQ
jgi:DNA-binding MarR family transcriptional regulator